MHWKMSNRLKQRTWKKRQDKVWNSAPEMNEKAQMAQSQLYCVAQWRAGVASWCNRHMQNTPGALPLHKTPSPLARTPCCGAYAIMHCSKAVWLLRTPPPPLLRGNGYVWKQGLQAMAYGGGRCYQIGLDRPTEEVG